jgi:dimethylargininase
MTYAGAYTVAMRRIAIVRGVPDSFADALVMGESPTIDVGRAREQHVAYVQFLADNGYELRMLEADEGYPDCPFVEDVVVVLDSVAALTRPGAESRRGEVAAMAAELEGVRRLRQVTEPGTLDGGDVLRLGDTIYAGLSARTNREGIRQLTAIAGEDDLRVIPVPVSGVLHLKSAVARLDDDTVLLAPDCVDPDVFADYRIVEKVSAEAHLASVLSLDGGGLAMTTTAPLTLERLRAAGYDPALVDSSEFQAADGGLTCLSVLVDRVE